MLDLYQRVAVNRDIDEAHLKAGDVGWLIDYMRHSEGGEDGYVLEIYNALGESIGVVAVPVSAVEMLRADQILSVRALAGGLN
jgi:hypothetical protein